MQYTKQPTSVRQQISLLKTKGMIFNDENEAQSIFEHIAYYRLRAYWVIFELNSPDKQFILGTNFSDIKNLYDFDGSLRDLILANIGLIEISLRAVFSNLSLIHKDSHFYLNTQHFQNQSIYNKSLRKVEDSIKKNVDETFINHYSTTYSLPKMPPVWSIIEISSIGELQYWIKNLNNSELDHIVKKYGFVSRRPFISMLERICIVRNICAHHNRLWNRKIVKKQLMQMKKPIGFTDSFNAVSDAGSSFFGTFLYLYYVLKNISNNTASKFLQDFSSLVIKHQINSQLMGFPEQWQDLPIFHEI